jgi:hypothetical protein
MLESAKNHKLIFPGSQLDDILQNYFMARILCLPLLLVLGALGSALLRKWRGGGFRRPLWPLTPQDQPVLTAKRIGLINNQPLAGAAVIAVFDDPAYVDTGGSTSSESDNVQAGLAAMGHIVVPFTGIDEASWTTALAGAVVLVIPELEVNSNLGNDLSPEARSVITSFVDQGGGLIQFYNGPDFLNPVFGFILAYSGGDTSYITAEAVGTAFEGGPASIPSNNATGGLNASTFPAGGLSIYSSGGSNAEAALLPYGGGQIVYLGWDWYDAAPPGWTVAAGCAGRAAMQVTSGCRDYSQAGVVMIFGSNGGLHTDSGKQHGLYRYLYTGVGRQSLDDRPRHNHPGSTHGSIRGFAIEVV